MSCPVLIVEDDADLRELMCLLLANEGFDPIVACDGLDALQQLKSSAQRPCLGNR